MPSCLYIELYRIVQFYTTRITINNMLKLSDTQNHATIQEMGDQLEALENKIQQKEEEIIRLKDESGVIFLS